MVEDYALALPPLNMKLAAEQMSRTRIHRQLQGYRSRAAVDLDAVALTLNKVSQLVVDFPEIAEMDINPLLADADGVTALDARIKVGVPVLAGAARLAIRPYPKSLEDRITIKDGRQFLVRLILPEDEPLVHHLVENQTAEDLRLRIGHARAVNFAGKSTLADLPLLYSVSAVMVSNDSGPAHFASVTDMPTIVLFGPETPALYAPLGRVTAITAGLACSPCVSAANHRKTACTDPVCMTAILPERVLETVATILDAKN